MGIYNNIGSTTAVIDQIAKDYLNGTPKLDVYRKRIKNKVNDSINIENEKAKKRYMEKVIPVLFDGITESMFDSSGNLNPTIKDIIELKWKAFNAGWNGMQE